MRKPFIEKLEELAKKDPKVILIIGDVGFSFLEPFIKQFPNQFLNAGIGEQNMMGMAAGLSKVNWKPAVYTMRNFIVFRPLEQVRNDLGFPCEDVMLFGVSGSEAYRFLGSSHNVYQTRYGEEEDILIMKTIPNMNVYQPKTEEKLKEMMQFEYERKGPSYFVI